MQDRNISLTVSSQCTETARIRHPFLIDRVLGVLPQWVPRVTSMCPTILKTRSLTVLGQRNPLFKHSKESPHQPNNQDLQSEHRLSYPSSGKRYTTGQGQDFEPHSTKTDLGVIFFTQPQNCSAQSMILDRPHYSISCLLHLLSNWPPWRMRNKPPCMMNT